MPAKKRDRLYLLFFIIHVPAILLVDLVPLYPAKVAGQELLARLRAWYIETYKDLFFVNPPTWFTLYTWMEATYHLPLSIWAIGALMKDDPNIPLQLLIFACQTFMSTVTCIAELSRWEHVSMKEKMDLCALYVPYAVIVSSSRRSAEDTASSHIYKEAEYSLI